VRARHFSRHIFHRPSRRISCEDPVVLSRVPVAAGKAHFALRCVKADAANEAAEAPTAACGAVLEILDRDFAPSRGPNDVGDADHRRASKLGEDRSPRIAAFHDRMEVAGAFGDLSALVPLKTTLVASPTARPYQYSQ
jgi:hypothetical protein